MNKILDYEYNPQFAKIQITDQEASDKLDLIWKKEGAEKRRAFTQWLQDNKDSLTVIGDIEIDLFSDDSANENF